MAKDTFFSSPSTISNLERQFGQKAKSVKIEMKHQKQVRRYIERLDEIRSKTPKEKLIFG